MQKQKEIDDLLSSNIMKWVISYYQVVTCRLIIKAFNEPLTRTAINNSVNAECNSLLRKVSKFKEHLSIDCYESTCQSIQDLKTDTQNIIINSLREERGILI